MCIAMEMARVALRHFPHTAGCGWFEQIDINWKDDDSKDRPVDSLFFEFTVRVFCDIRAKVTCALAPLHGYLEDEQHLGTVYLTLLDDDLERGQLQFKCHFANGEIVAQTTFG
ncbi:MAG TPA: hypothetical protein VMX18_03740 [Candidatus Bipolaricaulota bacterium]|nr:hypothetical protein [Candidatus Bipolaricaulota bacterium]